MMNNKHIETLHSLQTSDEVLPLEELKETLEDKGNSVLTAKDWSMLLGGFLSDNRLVTRHSELLDSENENVALKAVELGYKIKGKLQEIPTETITIKLDFLQ